MYKEIIKEIEPEIEKAMGYLKEELGKIRTSRPSPSLLENIEAECFGKKFPLKQLGLINVTGPREMALQPWDQSYLEPISAAISRSSLGATVSIEKTVIRITFPSLTEEHRKNLAKLLSQKAEETRKTIRHWRQQAWDEIQDKTRSGEVREDDKYRAKDELQEMVDNANDEIEKLWEEKEKEIME